MPCMVSNQWTLWPASAGLVWFAPQRVETPHIPQDFIHSHVTTLATATMMHSTESCTAQNGHRFLLCATGVPCIAMSGSVRQHAPDSWLSCECADCADCASLAGLYVADNRWQGGWRGHIPCIQLPGRTHAGVGAMSHTEEATQECSSWSRSGC